MSWLGANNRSISSAGGQQQLTFPALGSYKISGPQSYDNAAVVNRSMLEDICIFGIWNGWQSSRSQTMAQIVNSIHAGSVRNTKVVLYTIADQAVDFVNFPAFMAAVNGGNFWLRSAYPSGTILQLFGSTQGALNQVAGGPTYNGRTYDQFHADYWVDYAMNGDAAGLATDGTDAPNQNVDGMYLDNLQVALPITADWARTGSSSGTAAQLRAGQLSILQRVQSAKGILIGGNLAAMASVGTVTTEYNGKLDLGVMEGAMGSTFSVDTFTSGNVGVPVATAYAKQMAVLNSNQLGVYVHAGLTSTGTDTYTTSPAYQAMRNGLANCLVCGNGRYYPSGTPQNTYVPISDSALWFDEFAVNTTTAVPVSQSFAADWMGYLGPAIDPPQTTAFQGVLWRRRFANGEAWWSPKGSGGGTATFGRTVRFINGSQAPAVNTGGTGTSRAMSARDGLIVLY